MKVIDAHIHVSSLKNQHTLRWHGDHPLNKNNRLEDYLASIGDDHVEVDGVVVIEFAPIADMMSLDGCQNAIEEYKYHGRIASGTLAADEGSNDYADKIKGIIPWAPMPMGAAFVEQYVEKLKDENFHLVKGFRYLLQDKQPGVMLEPKFVDAMKWIERNNYVFDWGIDLRSGGLWQYEESIELFKQVPNVKYIINHLGKPTFKKEDVDIWKKKCTEIYHLTPHSYMKLSGGFSELPEDVVDDIEKSAELIFPWFKAAFDLWGVDRTVWASNWPVCEIAKPGVVANWLKITEILFDKIGLSEKDRRKIYYINHKYAYNL